MTNPASQQPAPIQELVPISVLQCANNTARRRGARIKELETALRDMLAIAEFDEWHCASTGRQLVYRAALAALATPLGTPGKGEK